LYFVHATVLNKAQKIAKIPARFFHMPLMLISSSSLLSHLSTQSRLSTHLDADCK